MSAFSLRFHELRKERGYTMDHLADSMNKRFGENFSKSTFSKWENGRQEPSFSYVIMVSEFFDVSVDYLIGISDDRTPKRTRDMYTARDEDEKRLLIKYRNAKDAVGQEQKKIISDSAESNMDTLYKLLGIDDVKK